MKQKLIPLNLEETICYYSAICSGLSPTAAAVALIMWSRLQKQNPLFARKVLVVMFQEASKLLEGFEN